MRKAIELREHNYWLCICITAECECDLCFSRPSISCHLIFWEDECISSLLSEIVSCMHPEWPIHSSIWQDDLWPTEIGSRARIWESDSYFEWLPISIDKRNLGRNTSSMCGTDNLGPYSTKNRIELIPCSRESLDERWLMIRGSRCTSLDYNSCRTWGSRYWSSIHRQSTRREYTCRNHDEWDYSHRMMVNEEYIGYAESSGMQGGNQIGNNRDGLFGFDTRSGEIEMRITEEGHIYWIWKVSNSSIWIHLSAFWIGIVISKSSRIFHPDLLSFRKSCSGI